MSVLKVENIWTDRKWNMGERGLSELIKSTQRRRHSESETEQKRKKAVKLEAGRGYSSQGNLPMRCVIFSQGPWGATEGLRAEES